MEPRRQDWNFVIFLFQWCKGPKATRIFNKKCEWKNSLRNICSGNYGQRWFQMLSALFSVNTFPQSFNEEEHYYLFWFKMLPTECIFLLFTVHTKQWVHLFCCNQSHINQHKLRSEQSFLLLTQANLSLYLVSARTSLKGWVSSRIWKVTQVRGFYSWNYEVIPQIKSPQKPNQLK